MQDNLDRNYPSLRIQIIGVNQANSNPTGFITEGRDLPWVNDTDTNLNGLSDVRDEMWQVEYRDVVILDEENNLVFQYNVTTNNLDIPDNFNELEGRLIDAAAKPPESAWQSPIEPLDVNFDRAIGPLDALLVINELGVHPNGMLPQSMANRAPYVDITGDGIVAPFDALAVINQLDVISQLDSRAALSSHAVVDTGVSTASTLPMARTSHVAPTESIFVDAAPVTELVSPLFSGGSGDLGHGESQRELSVDSTIADLVFASL